MTSSRQRLIARLPQRLYPEPAAVTITAYRPFESRWVRGTASWGELNRRRIGGT